MLWKNTKGKEILMKKDNIREVNLYIVVGVLTTLINFIVFNIGLYFNINYRISNTVAFIFSIIFAYIANKLFVFKSKTTGFIELGIEFIKFVSSRLLTYLFELGSLIICVEKICLGKNTSKIIISIIVVILNYILSKTIFSHKGDKVG